MSSPTIISKGVFGLVSETGLITQSISYDFQSDKTELKDATGYVVGVAYFNETAIVSISAKVEDDSPFSGQIATILTLQNTMPDHITAGGTLLIDDLSISKEMGEYNSIDINATYYPSVTVA